MNKKKILTLIFFTTSIIIIYYFKKISKNESLYIKSKLDDEEYYVQNLENKEEASYILSIIKKKIEILMEYLEENKKKYKEYEPYINLLLKIKKKIILEETSINSKYTSYTLEKGKKISLCLRSKKTKKIYDINTIMYVVIHELAHVACPDKNHTKLFYKIFIFLLKTSIYLKIYKNINYKNNPHEYCGIVINENLIN